MKIAQHTKFVFGSLFALVSSASILPAGTLTLETTVTASNPDILAYNVGHFVANSNTHDWWRYAGVNGARIFLSASTIEPNDDIPGTGDGVTDQASFLSRKSALRANPLNTSYIDWPDFEDRYENKLTGNSSGGNRFRANYALGKLRELDIQILAQITGSENSLPIADSNDWAGKWEFWQHYYAQAFYLGREFDVERYQMYNEPNHPNANGLTAANWLMRLQLASDAIQSALADVNSLYSKALTPLIYGPVNSGGDQYSGWGDLAVQNRHTNFLGLTDPGYLVMHRYDYHQYNDTPSEFGSDLDDMKSAIAADMAPETRFRMSISEFNVHTNGTFDTIAETLDTPEKYTRLGAISVELAKKFEKELYCFKFAQTPNSSGAYPVSKNGMHYVHNAAEPYNYGGATRAAEVWRLFNKALKPGGDQLGVDRDVDGSLDDLDLRATYDPATDNYYIFSANEGSSTGITFDTTAWGIPEGTPYLLEEVSDDYFGIVRRWETVLADGTLFDGTDNNLVQPSDSVWLITIPASPVESEEVLEASFDATVTDGIHSGTHFGSTNTLLARNDPASVDNRSAGLIQFDLPVLYPPDIHVAIFSVSGKTGTLDASVHGHVYGIEDDAWADNTVTWDNAPNLLKGASTGNLITDRVITGQGDSAFIQGQLVFNRTSNKVRRINVTDFVKGQSDGKASFLISQDPRWDVALPSLATGDTQVDGLEIKSSENGSANYPGPQLRLVLRKDTDGDGISDVAEVDTFLTNPGIADSDGDELSDGDEVLIYDTDPLVGNSDGDALDDGQEILAGSDPKDSSSVFTITEYELQGNGSLKIVWPSLLGRTYTVYRALDLPATGWVIQGSQAGTGADLEHVDMDMPPETDALYQIKVEYTP